MGGDGGVCFVQKFLWFFVPYFLLCLISLLRLPHEVCWRHGVKKGGSWYRSYLQE